MIEVGFGLYPVSLRTGEALSVSPFLFQPLRYPLWIPAAVEYGSNAGNILLNAIIHCVGKTLGKETMIAVVDGMNAP